MSIRASFFSAVLAVSSLVACGRPEVNTESQVAVRSSEPTHEICGDDINVRNSEMKVFASAFRGELITPTGKSKQADGHVFMEVYFFSEPSGLGWVASQYICKKTNPTYPDVQGPARIEISLRVNRLKLFKGNTLVLETNVGTGRYGHATPQGNFRIVNKEVCPPYYGDGSVNVPGCTAANPFGTRALWFVDGVYGVHGTDKPWLIGEGTTAEDRRVSKGCVRVNTKTIEWIFKQVKVGDPIKITW